MVFDLYREALFTFGKRDALRHGPRLEGPIELQAKT
jgi:hypothetical protein